MSAQPSLTRSKLPLSGRIVMFFIRHIQHAMASMGELWRNPISSLMTMAVLGVSLSLPAALQVLVKNAETITQSWNSAAQISLFIEGTAQSRVFRACWRGLRSTRKSMRSTISIVTRHWRSSNSCLVSARRSPIWKATLCRR